MLFDLCFTQSNLLYSLATVCIKSGARDIAFEATDIDATVHGITGPKVEPKFLTFA